MLLVLLLLRMPALLCVLLMLRALLLRVRLWMVPCSAGRTVRFPRRPRRVGPLGGRVMVGGGPGSCGAPSAPHAVVRRPGTAAVPVH